MRFAGLEYVLVASLLMIDWPTAHAASGDSGAFRVDKFPDVRRESLAFFDWNATETSNSLYLAGITGLTHKSGDTFYAISELDENPSYFWILQLRRDSIPRISGNATRLSLPNAVGSPGTNAILDSPQALAYMKNSDDLYIAHDKDVITLFDRDNGVRDSSDNYASGISLPFENGKGLESLSFDLARPNVLWTASEVCSQDDKSDWIRFIAIDLNDRTTLEEYVYRKESDTGNGVVSIIALDHDGSFLVLERVATGNDYSVDHLVRLYFAYCDKTLDVGGYTQLKGVSGVENFLKKHELLQVSELEPYSRDSTLNVGRFEAMALQSMDKDKARFVMVSNNGFQEGVRTQVLTVDLDIDLINVVEPEDETDTVSRSPNDRAISAKAWIHPEDPRDSLIFGTLSNSGLGVYTLGGEEVAKVKHQSSASYYGVDLLYGFLLRNSNELDVVDLVVVTDQNAEKVVVFKIDPNDNDGGLVNITSAASNPTVNEPRAIAAYTSPFNGVSYVFVSSGDEIIQLKLTSDGNGKVLVERVSRHNGGNIDLQNQESLGMVVDREFGYLYAAVSNQGIWKWDAEPYEVSSSGQTHSVVDDRNKDFTGLDIYYGKEYDGYLVASFRGDSSFAVFERHGDNDFVDWFAVGANHHLGIDKTDNAEGLGLINVNLGPEFSCGLLMVQDAAAKNPEYVVDGNTLRNARTNFKLVPIENLERSLPKHLKIDTQTWGPRRFGLVRLVDALAQDVYNSLDSERLTPRDAQELLGRLGEAAFYLYPPGSMRRRLMSPTGGRRKFNSYKQTLNRRRHLRGLKKDDTDPAVRIPVCKRGSPKLQTRGKTDMNKAEDELLAFVRALNQLADRGSVDSASKGPWVDMAEAIIAALPEDVEYY